MMRHCDGQDPNLLRQLNSGAYVPCDCGQSFDDVNHMVIFPHDLIFKDMHALRRALGWGDVE